MFGKDFYPTPVAVIEKMLSDISIKDKIILEPSAGKGNIVDYLKSHGAYSVVACEKNEELRLILKEKCHVIAGDFLSLTSEDISQIDMIVMNPPFSADEKHILHAWNIAPEGCKIISLCNSTLVTKTSYYSSRIELKNIIEAYGFHEVIGNVFSDAERETEVSVAIVRLQKPSNGASMNSEFDGFFMEEDQPEEQANGILPYNFIRDVVNRYVEAVKLYDKQIELSLRMYQLTESYFFAKEKDVADRTAEKDVPAKRAQFKKEMQKEGWNFIFQKLNMEKYATKGLREDINKFVEQQHHIPFSMRNIYHMLSVVAGTQEQRMNRAIIEVFDKLTLYSKENRLTVDGWKSNSYFLITRKFVMPYMVNHSSTNYFDIHYNGNADIIDDLIKALCHLTGENYNNIICLRHRCAYAYRLIDASGNYILRDTNGHSAVYNRHERDKAEWQVKFDADAGRIITIADDRPVYGQWFNWHFFEVKAFKKGTMHFRFKDEKVWNLLNQKIAEIKGYPLVLTDLQTKYQNRNAKRA